MSILKSDDDSVNVFISYSSEDRKLAGKIKKGLEILGFKCFLAHEDISAGKWREVIDNNLEEFDVFLPLLTESAKRSVWVHQECGIAHYRKRKKDNISIIPLKVNYDPEGCLSIYQAHKLEFNFFEVLCFKGKNILDLSEKIVQETNLKKKVKRSALEGLVDASKLDAELIFDFAEWIGISLEDVEIILEGVFENSILHASATIFQRVKNYFDRHKGSLTTNSRDIWARYERKCKKCIAKERENQRQMREEALKRAKELSKLFSNNNASRSLKPAKEEDGNS